MLDQFDPTGLILCGNQWVDPSAHLLVGVPGPFGNILYQWMTPDERHSYWYEQEAKTKTVACARARVADLVHVIPPRWIFADAVNNISKREAACCRDVLSHDIEAFYTCLDEMTRETPDLYVTHCKCGRKHRRAMVGEAPGSGTKLIPQRPVW